MKKANDSIRTSRPHWRRAMAAAISMVCIAQAGAAASTADDGSQRRVGAGACFVDVSKSSSINAFAVTAVVTLNSREFDDSRKPQHYVCFVHGGGGRYIADNRICVAFPDETTAHAWRRTKQDEINRCSASPR